jgi:hypothetical protein
VKHLHLPHQMTITWEATSLTVSDEGLESPRCRGCRIDLNVHQPDEEHPEHLLGTCALCGTWYLIEVGRKGTEAFLFDLPNIDVIRKAVASTRAEPVRKPVAKRPAGVAARGKHGEQLA